MYYLGRIADQHLLPVVRPTTLLATSTNLNFGPVLAGAATMAVTANRIYYRPFVSSLPFVAGSNSNELLQVEVTANAAGTAAVGIYSRHPTTFLPDTLLSSGSVSITANGLFSVSMSPTITVSPNTLYWVACVFSSAVTVRAYAASSACILARSSNAAVTFAFQSGSSLPASAGSTFNYGTGSVPWVARIAVT